MRHSLPESPGTTRPGRGRPGRSAGLLGIALLALLLSACGFQLRGSQPLPAALVAVNLQVPPGEPDLQRDLRRALEARGTRVAEAADASTLHILGARYDRRILSIGPDGKVREYELRYEVRFALQPAGAEERAPVRSVTVLRDYSYSELRVLGKDEERDLLRTEMRREAVNRIVNQLSH
ncbi:MAG: LPS assembly lipoprotein LptE [Gammaproteobacteria bacterium]|nr:LPS assembly lipoprotein LptE [Gammaproteobacteria bacterium]